MTTTSRMLRSGALALVVLGGVGLAPAAATAAPKPSPFAGTYRFTRTHSIYFRFYPQSEEYLVDWDVTIASDGTLSGSGTGFVSFDRLGVHYDYEMAGTMSGSVSRRGARGEGSFSEVVRNTPYVAPKVNASLSYSIVCSKDAAGDLVVSRDSQTPEVWTRQ